MNIFDKIYNLPSHTFLVRDVFLKLAFLTKNGMDAHALKLFALWFFPRVKNEETQADEIDKILNNIPDEYKLALNDLIGADLVTIYEVEGEYFINVTESGRQYIPKPRAFDIKAELRRMKLYSAEIAQLEASAPADKKGFFKSMFA